MLGTCPLVVIHGGDVTSESVVLVVRTTRSGSPCCVGGITTTTSAGGRPFVSRALLCPALPCPGGFAGYRRIDLAMLRKHSPGCPRGSQIIRARWALLSVVDWPRARRPVVSCLAGLRAMPRPAGSRKASAPQRGAEPW